MMDADNRTLTWNVTKFGMFQKFKYPSATNQSLGTKMNSSNSLGIDGVTYP